MSEVSTGVRRRLTKKGVEHLRTMARPMAHFSPRVEERNVFISDADMDAFRRDVRDHWALGCMMRDLAGGSRKRTMSKRQFKNWLKSIETVDEDRPIREQL